jgi:hypothetical protein
VTHDPEIVAACEGVKCELEMVSRSACAMLADHPWIAPQVVVQTDRLRALLAANRMHRIISLYPVKVDFTPEARAALDALRALKWQAERQARAASMVLPGCAVVQPPHEGVGVARTLPSGWLRRLSSSWFVSFMERIVRMVGLRPPATTSQHVAKDRQ